MTTETITWHAADLVLPDDGTTVLMAIRGDSEPVWLGWHDGHTWVDASTGGAIDDPVTHWAHMPGGPAC